MKGQLTDYRFTLNVELVPYERVRLIQLIQKALRSMSHIPASDPETEALRITAAEFLTILGVTATGQ